MYIKNNDCDNCNNKNICKWCEEMARVQEAVKDVNAGSKYPLCPVKINIHCDRFQNKTTGFVNRQGN